MNGTGTSSDLKLIGNTPAICSLRDEIDAAARSDAKVLITGETGVGKDVTARLIHQGSERRLARIAVVNCAGLPDTLLESELFGHVRGSFTGAYRDKPGLLETAPNGTVFLDEVGDMSPRMQAVLLRFLETGELQRVGADRGRIVVNVRLIAATNRELAAEAAAGRFRHDLYYRLNVIRLHVPPLRERREDIPALANYFLKTSPWQHQAQPVVMSPEAMDLLAAQDWPGNVRQLRNMIERVVLRARGSVIRVRDLPEDIHCAPASVGTPTPGRAAELASGCPPAADLLARMIDGGESFWSVVYEPFMDRDLPRHQVRAVVARGLEQTRGNYRVLVGLFNMPTEDYKRFMTFLRKFNCRLPFHTFRMIPPRAPIAPRQTVGQAAAS